MKKLNTTVGVVVPALLERWTTAKFIVDEVPSKLPLIFVIDDVVDSLPKADVAALPDNVQIIYSGVRRGGVSRARNIGISALQGRTSFALLHDDDDSFHPELYTRYINHLAGHPDTALLYLGEVSTTISPVKQRKNRTKNQALYPLVTYLTRTCDGLCVDIDIHQKVGGFDEQLRKHEDREYLIRYLNDVTNNRTVFTAPAKWLCSPSHQYARLSNSSIIRSEASVQALQRLAVTASRYPTPAKLLPTLSGRVASECANSGDYYLALQAQHIGAVGRVVSSRHLKRNLIYRFRALVSRKRAGHI